MLSVISDETIKAQFCKGKYLANNVNSTTKEAFFIRLLISCSNALFSFGYTDYKWNVRWTVIGMFLTSWIIWWGRKTSFTLGKVFWPAGFWLVQCHGQSESQRANPWKPRRATPACSPPTTTVLSSFRRAFNTFWNILEVVINGIILEVVLSLIIWWTAQSAKCICI